MRLKRLQLIGFKSFANKTDILFDDGVTCVVGPNGCGKSNISDSVRWVLGERSAKLLRGSKMEDVIFNGTDFRKPTAMAEVSLTIDNSDRGLPIDYNEVTITRRLYRSGESEYLLNRTVCRLKDIQDIILDTGIGSNSYSMIEQGRIDYILSASADERRFLIEEAAGISKYKTKKDEAIRKLDRTEENRLRLTDIIQEVHKNIQYAERQAKRAERYKKLFEDLKGLEVTKAFYDIRQIRDNKSTLGAEKSKQESEIASIESKIRELKTAQDTLNTTLRGILDRFSQEDSKRHSLQSKIERIDQQIQFHQQQKMEMASRRGEISQEIKHLEERLVKNSEETQEKNKEVLAINERKDSAYALFQQSDQTLKEMDQRLGETRKQIEGLKSESIEAAAQASRVRNEYHRLFAFLESQENHKKKFESDNVRLEEEIQKWEAKKESSVSEIQTLDSKSGDLTQRTESLHQSVSEKKALYDEARKAFEELKSSHHEKKTKLEMLVEIDESFKSTDKDLWEGMTDDQRATVKALQDIFKPQPGFEWALEAALESFAKSLVVKNQDEAKAVLEQIRSRHIPSMGLFIHDPANQSSYISHGSKPVHEKIRCSLYDVVEIEAAYKGIFERLLQNTYILNNLSSQELLDEILPLAQFNRFVTQDGILLGPEYRILFRNTHLSSEDNLFQRTAEIDALRGQIKGLEESMKDNRDKAQSLEAQLHDLNQTLEAAKGEQVDARVQKESFQSLHGGMEERLSSLKRERQLSLLEVEEMNAQYTEAAGQKERVEKQLQEAENHDKQLAHRMEQYVTDREVTESRRSDFLEQYAKQKADFETLDERSKLLEDALNYLKQREAEDSGRIVSLKDEEVRIGEKETSIAREDEEAAIEKNDAENSRRDSEIALELIRQEKEEAEQAFSISQSAIDEQQNIHRQLEEDRHQLQMKDMDLGYQEKSIHERLQQTYHLNLTDFGEEQYPLQIPIEELIEKQTALQTKVESVGTVNLLAIEEYDELKQRYDFLMHQQKDLDDARDQLLETIRQINRTTKVLFEETFVKVQETFESYYTTLFNGGHAKLVLIDESHPLESGIDIVVRPPGKKLQNISLLSGGEKALTAIALLFALFKIKPSPFCVLDEVDAPLDEANIDRFLTVLRSFLQSSQFIIVTHNRKTIAMGDALYGVTMEEAGISKLVSVKVGQDTDTRLHNEDNALPDPEDELLSAEEGEEEQIRT